MDWMEIYHLTDETEQVKRTYEIFDENTRLNHSRAARVEFLTTVRAIEDYLKPGDRILDVGAGAGEYSLYFARKGFFVSALELSDANLTAFREKLTPELPVELVEGNALDLSRYPDNSYDVVLLFGPLYHLHSPEDKLQCIREAKRVCKEGGTLFFAFISHDMLFMTELGYDGDFFLGSTYDHETMRLEDFPFVFATVEECRQMLTRGGVTIVREIAADGFSELMAEKINAMDEESYRQYLRWHFSICEKPEFFGASNHLLFVGT